MSICIKSIFFTIFYKYVDYNLRRKKNYEKENEDDLKEVGYLILELISRMRQSCWTLGAKKYLSLPVFLRTIDFHGFFFTVLI